MMVTSRDHGPYVFCSVNFIIVLEVVSRLRFMGSKDEYGGGEEWVDVGVVLAWDGWSPCSGC